MANVIYRAAEWAGWPLTRSQLGQLETYGRWLRREGIPSGGLGPNEGDKIDSRHLADSLLFAGAWGESQPPRLLVDLGSGVGLPGIPLGILWPGSHVILVDRSGRRVDLTRRAIRVLRLPSVTVMNQDVAGLVTEAVDMVVARALAPAKQVIEWGMGLVRSKGIVVVGGSSREPPEPVMGEQILEVDSEVLDRPVWLRKMAAP